MKHKFTQAHLESLLSTKAFVESHGSVFDIELIRDKCREPHLVLTRALVATKLRNEGESYAFIGTCINRDHATVLHLLKIVNNTKFRKTTPRPLIRATIDELKAKINLRSKELAALKKKVSDLQKLRVKC